jgi:tRNA(fMet)-specific endonuclease VapC
MRLDCGITRANLEKMGTPIGAYDLMIAAHALSLGLVLVTNNEREFQRIPDLFVENWVNQ